jgi:hypothetical protein
MVVSEGSQGCYQEGRWKVQMTIKKTRGPFNKDPNPQKKNPDKIWCPKGEQYRYVEVCKASCKRIDRCEAYAGYREPKLI